MLRLIFTLLFLCVFAGYYASAPRATDLPPQSRSIITRGDVFDRQAAHEVWECMRGYAYTSVPEAEAQELCLELVSEMRGRDPARVKLYL